MLETSKKANKKLHCLNGRETKSLTQKISVAGELLKLKLFMLEEDQRLSVVSSIVEGKMKLPEKLDFLLFFAVFVCHTPNCSACLIAKVAESFSDSECIAR